jgi:Tol biopolymer transport system component
VERQSATIALGGVAGDASPDLVPGGDKIVFSRGSLGGKPQQICTINADGTGLTRITPTSNDSITADQGLR